MTVGDRRGKKEEEKRGEEKAFKGRVAAQALNISHQTPNPSQPNNPNLDPEALQPFTIAPLDFISIPVASRSQPLPLRSEANGCQRLGFRLVG
jgi:hypothetical protein